MVDELAAARFVKKASGEPDTDNPPTVAEVLNAALQVAGEDENATRVIVLVTNSTGNHMAVFQNVPSKAEFHGLMHMANNALLSAS